MNAAILVVFTVLGAASAQMSAHCRIAPNSGNAPVEGNITFTQQSSSSNIEITVDLIGFPVIRQSTRHGFHVHEHGSLGNSCLDAGGHYNPDGKTHGGPADAERHVGDLGNILVTNGAVHTTIIDHLVTLYGSKNVLNRAIVVHEGQDDLGRGCYPDSNTTGHAGARMGCCVITGDSTSR